MCCCPLFESLPPPGQSTGHEGIHRMSVPTAKLTEAGPHVAITSNASSSRRGIRSETEERPTLYWRSSVGKHAARSGVQGTLASSAPA